MPPAGKVVNDSVGGWGPIPMPPTSVPQADLDTLIKSPFDERGASAQDLLGQRLVEAIGHDMA